MSSGREQIRAAMLAEQDDQRSDDATIRTAGPVDLPINPTQDELESLDPRKLRTADDALGSTMPQPRPADWETKCPVVPLGKDGDNFYYLNAAGQLISRDATQHNQAYLNALFAPYIAVLDHWWPKFKKAGDQRDGKPGYEWSGCSYDKVQRDLMIACGRKGTFSPFGTVRGVGAWVDIDGQLVLHLGNQLWSQGKFLPPGPLGEQVYTAGPKQPVPAIDATPEQQIGASREMMAMLRTWNFSREIDPLLLLGWIGAAKIGGALDWRPALWLTGDAGTGKSTLQKALSGLFGPAIVQTSDATGAGVWQVVGHSSIPVAIDEMEPSDNAFRQKQVIDLARQASSGGVILRGGNDHSGHQFKAQSSFLFSSILIPPMTQADRSRLAILELGQLRTTTDSVEPDLSERRMRTLGNLLHGRMVAGWPLFGSVLQAYRKALIHLGHKSRGADTFGTLMACATLLTEVTPSLDQEVILRRCAPLAADLLTETAEAEEDWSEMLQHLTSQQIHTSRTGETILVGRAIEKAVTQGDHDTMDAARFANGYLARNGLAVFGPHLPCPPALRSSFRVDRTYVAVVRGNHASLAKLFVGTKWAGGVWSQSCGRVPGRIAPKANIRIGGVVCRVILLPLEVVQGGQPPEDDIQSAVLDDGGCSDM